MPGLALWRARPQRAMPWVAVSGRGATPPRYSSAAGMPCRGGAVPRRPCREAEPVPGSQAGAVGSAASSSAIARLIHAAGSSRRGRRNQPRISCRAGAGPAAERPRRPIVPRGATGGADRGPPGRCARCSQRRAAGMPCRPAGHLHPISCASVPHLRLIPASAGDQRVRRCAGRAIDLPQARR